MEIVEWVGIAAIILLAGLVVIFARREIIARRGGTIGMSMRLSTMVQGRGWAPGLGRFTAEDLRWYRLFSVGLRPRRVLSRHGLEILERRRPEGAERHVVPDGWIVVRCKGATRSSESAVELAIAESALSGFLSWVESAPRSITSL
jgi:hypothetical protein